METIDINLHTGYIPEGHDRDVLERESHLITNSVELFFQEVEMCVKTSLPEVWNLPKAVDIKRYVFNKFITVTGIRNELLNYINENCSQSPNVEWDLKVMLEEGPDGKDIVFIIVSVTDPENNHEWLNKYIIG